MRSMILLGLVLALEAGGSLVPAQAAAQKKAGAAREQLEASMVLTGSIDISPSGQVDGFSLRDEDRLGGHIVSFLRDSVAGWRFEPVVRDGEPVAARTPVSIRLLARSTADGRMNAVLQSANFQEYDPDETDSVRPLSMPPPGFPNQVAQMSGGGEVLLLIQVARDGSVADVVAEQVNLHVRGPMKVMQNMRDALATSSLGAARDWKFRPPSTGEDKDDPFWTVRVPVHFAKEGARQRYGKWQAYLPGPRQRAPWRGHDADDDNAADALPEGGVYMVGLDKGPRLLTPLGG